MAHRLDLNKAKLSRFLVLLLPLGLWWMIWLGISPGSVSDIFSPSSFQEFLHGLRAASPFVVTAVAALFMLAQLPNRGRGSPFFFSPLALTVVYGLIGVVGSLRSPDASVSLYWTFLYLTVPLVLSFAIWGPDPLRQIERMIKLNWLIIGLGFVALFFIGMISLDLGETILRPANLLKCERAGGWFNATSEVIRSTGVARFAAVTGILALSLVWNGRVRTLWGIVFLASIVLLLSTGSRGSIVAFAAATPLVFWLMSGKKAKIGALIGVVLLVPILWSTGTAETFLQRCLLKQAPLSGIEYLNLRTPTGSGVQRLSTIEYLNLRTPTGSGVQRLSTTEDSTLDSEPLGVRGEQLNSGFLIATGRIQIWEAGWAFIKISPFIGYGFQADRLVLGTHMHNATMHALIQTGFLGTIPFVGAVLWAWFILIKALRNINRFSPTNKTLLVQVAGMLVFLSIRSLPESTGAFFGIDWLLLAPLLLYLGLIDSGDSIGDSDAR